MFEISLVFSAVGAMLLIGAFSNKLSSKFNVPILLLFLLFGMFAGQGHTPGNLEFSAVSIAGTVAMCFILFSGQAGFCPSFKITCADISHFRILLSHWDTAKLTYPQSSNESMVKASWNITNL